MKTSMKNVERFTETLHGSGINSTWDISENRQYIRASNIYDTMNNVGMYDNPAAFTVLFPKNGNMDDFKLEFNGQLAQRMNQKYMLRDFLEDQIAFAVDEETAHDLGV